MNERLICLFRLMNPWLAFFEAAPVDVNELTRRETELWRLQSERKARDEHKRLP